MADIMTNYTIEAQANVDRRLLRGLTLATAAVTFAVAFFNPRLLSFRPFTVAEFIQLVSPLLMVALFIERVLEVFLTSLRLQRSAMPVEGLGAGPSATKAEQQAADNARLNSHKHSRTKRIAFITGTTLGAIVAALGVRVLESIVDPNVFAALPHMHQRLFKTADVLFTGAVLGGGSDALHQMVRVFTTFFESAAGRMKEGAGRGKSAQSAS